MTRPREQENDREVCPKRPWIMSSLSDDEHTDGDGAPSRGVQFHLAQCGSCRRLADRLRAVTTALGELADLDPPEDLAGRAHLHVMQAIRDGAQLTGRVEIREEVYQNIVGSRRANLRLLAPYAAAASILLVAGVFWASHLVGPEERLTGNGPYRVGEFATIGPAPDESTPSASSQPLGVDPAERSIDEHLADRSTDDSPHHKRRRVCKHGSHIEAALSDDDTCILRAVIVPNRDERQLGWGPVFDIVPEVESTTRLLRDE